MGWPKAFALNATRLPVAVFTLRQKLYEKAKREPTFRFYSLYGLIARLDVLEAAWDLVAANGGAAGVDGVTIRQIETTPGGVGLLVAALHRELCAKQYTPLAVRRVFIPKADGKRRPLGIPAVRDRVVQAAARLILEPIFEADFHEASYGYRPGRTAHEALAAIARTNSSKRFCRGSALRRATRSSDGLVIWATRARSSWRWWRRLVSSCGTT